MVVVMASLLLPLCIAVVIIIPLLSTIVFVGLLDFGHCHCLFVLLLSSSCHHCKMVVIMASSSLSLCVAVVIIVPLLSTIVFVGLLDFGHRCHLFVLLLSHHCFCCCCCCCLLWVIIIVTLCCCCHCHPLVVNPCSCWIVGLLDCWFIGLLVYWTVGLLIVLSKKILYLMFVFEIILGVFGTEHVAVWTDSLVWPTFNDISLSLFYILFHVLIEFEIADREIIEK